MQNISANGAKQTPKRHANIAASITKLTQKKNANISANGAKHTEKKDRPDGGYLSANVEWLESLKPKVGNIVLLVIVYG